MIENDYPLEHLDDFDEAVKDFAEGKFVILLDAKERENEGDLTIASQYCTPEAINFMTKYARGLICTPMTEKRLKRLKLDQMVHTNTESHGTAFTVSCDLKKGNTTGISAADRARTIRALINPSTKPDELARPGHIFPLKAKKGGTLVRTGQTEGSIDLCRIAGLCPSASICEIMNDDGTMARLNDLIPFAKEHNIKIISVAQIIAHRCKNEKLIKKINSSKIKTEFSEFKVISFRDKVYGVTHLALIKGNIDNEKDVLVRMHSECVLGNVFHSSLCDCQKLLRKSMDMINKEGKGVIIYLRQNSSAEKLIKKIELYNNLDYNNLDSIDENNLQKDDEKDYNIYSIGIGAQILKDLGITSFKLLSNSPKKFIGVEGFNLKISDIIPIEIEEDIKTRNIGHNIDERSFKE